MSDSLPLPAQLSAAFVAFTIEADNEAELRVTHHTTSHGAAGPRRSVWMTSLAMWFNCLRDLHRAGPLTVSALEHRARMPTNLDGMRRWGYVTIDGAGRVTRDQKRPRAGAGSVLALTRRGEAAADLWEPIPERIEERWRARLGAEPVGRLRGALGSFARAYERPLPDFLPIGSARGVGIEDPPERETPDDVDGLALVSLLGRALLAFALDYERGAKLSLGVQLDGLRVLDAAGVPIRDLPRLTGVSKEAMAMILKRLQESQCVVIEPIPGARRGKQVRLTDDRGVWAKAAGARRCDRIHDAWRERYGPATVSAIHEALAPIAGDGTRAGSPLFDGLRPPAGTWRAGVPAPERLPFLPMVLHRGGYPDGS
jgi:hypothetical protein